MLCSLTCAIYHALIAHLARDSQCRWGRRIVLFKSNELRHRITAISDRRFVPGTHLVEFSVTPASKGRLQFEKHSDNCHQASLQMHPH